MHNKSREVCVKTRSPPASLPFRGQVTKPTTVRWSIVKYSSRLIMLINSNWVESEIVFTFYIVRSVRSPEIEAKFEFYFNWFQLEKNSCFVWFSCEIWTKNILQKLRNHERYCKRSSYFTATAALVEYSKVNIESYNASGTWNFWNNLAKYSSLCSFISLNYFWPLFFSIAFLVIIFTFLS